MPARPRRRDLNGPGRPRALNIEDDLWVEALAVARAREESLSAVVRAFLRSYVKRHRHLLEER